MLCGTGSVVATGCGPLGVLTAAVAAWRRRRTGHAAGVPVVVVGNVTVGGTGKTPLVVELAMRAARLGARVAVICRGHRGKRRGVYRVSADLDVRECGDEALLLARKLDCPVYAGRKRPRWRALLQPKAPP